METKQVLLLKLILAKRINKRRKRKIRASYVRSIFLNRNHRGELFLVKELRNDPQYHHRYFRMDKENFNHIFNEIEELISHGHNHIRPISALERLSITLRYLATGNSQISLAFCFRISPSSISRIIRETLTAVCKKFKAQLQKPNQPVWIRSAQTFEAKWNFPNCCGAIDGKHIRMKAPTASGSEFYNYKNFFSIVLLAIVDPNYRFSLVDIGASGSNSDGGILMRSSMGRHLDADALDFPAPKDVDGKALPHVILGDEGFPLKANIMKPYAGKFLEQEKRIFNYRLSRARMVSENAFGILAARWRIFHTSIDCDLELAKLIVKTCVILHNFLQAKGDSVVTGDRDEEGDIIQGNWRELNGDGNGILGITRQGSNNYATDAYEIREAFKDHFVKGSGEVSWQIRHVNRGTD